jgi:hypothetical protein
LIIRLLITLISTPCCCHTSEIKEKSNFTPVPSAGLTPVKYKNQRHLTPMEYPEKVSAPVKPAEPFPAGKFNGVN